jgi:hypothetical protein
MLPTDISWFLTSDCMNVFSVSSDPLFFFFYLNWAQFFPICKGWTSLNWPRILSRVGCAQRKWRVLVRMIGFNSTLVTTSLNYSQYSDIADLHTLHFTVARTLGFSVSTSRLLATDLNTETITSNHYKVFLSSTNFPGYHPSRTQNCHLKLKTVSQSQSHIATDGQSVSKSWYRAPSGAHDQIFIIVWQLTVLFLWGALSAERTGWKLLYL